MIACVGGATYPPRVEGVERLLRDLRQGFAGGRTLGGCLVLPRRGRVLVCREPEAVASPAPARPGERTGWDGRFVVRLPAAAPEGLGVAARGNSAGAPSSVPPAARPTLPVIRDAAGATSAHAPRFRPDRALTQPGFAVF